MRRKANARIRAAIGFEAVRLFVARVRAFQPHFALTVDMAPAIAEVCVRLSGLPLAIELAAARIRQFTPSALVAQVRGDTLFPLLSTGPRDLPARQQALHSAITWSYNLLDPNSNACCATWESLSAVDARDGQRCL